MRKIVFTKIKFGLFFCFLIISFSTFGVSEMDGKNRFKVTNQKIPERSKAQKKGKKQSWLKKLFSKKKQKIKRKRHPIFSILALVILFSTAFILSFFATALFGWAIFAFAVCSILGFLQTKIWKGIYKEGLAKFLFWSIVWTVGLIILIFILLLIFVFPNLDFE